MEIEMKVSKFVAASVTSASLIGLMGFTIAQTTEGGAASGQSQSPASSEPTNMNNRTDSNLDRGTGSANASGELAPRADRN
jgi:hypothetical protein